LTSTDVTPIRDTSAAHRRLPPLPGLLADLLDQAIRTRQRRVMVDDHPGQSLAALKVMDAAIDRALVAASLYGSEALREAQQRITQHSGPDARGKRAAALFVGVALAVQMQTADVNETVLRHALHAEPAGELTSALMGAVHDALKFYPVPNGDFGDHVTHLVSLFVFAKSHPDLMPLALKLVGERDIQSLRKGVLACLAPPTPPAWTPWAHYALACMGFADEDTRQFVDQGLNSGDPSQLEAALRVCAVDSRLASDRALELGLRAPAASADTAWAVLACRYPRRVLDYAFAMPELDVAVKVRLVALTGFMDAAIAVCGELAQREGSVTPAEADVLELVLGHVPVEARTQPNDRAAKSAALRALVLQVCRQAHIAVRNDADQVAWQVEKILADRAQAALVRVRAGLRITQDVPALGAGTLRVTHGLRQWLYVERAVYGKHAFSLSAHDVSRRQDLALMVADFADEVRDQ
jgi:hypothetical protein